MREDSNIRQRQQGTGTRKKGKEKDRRKRCGKEHELEEPGGERGEEGDGAGGVR